MNNSDIKILCVDDEPDILEILKYNLSNEGYQISTAKDGEIAIKKAREIEPNLIIMDIMTRIVKKIIRLLFPPFCCQLNKQ